jgi:hypothetical protein
MTDSNVISLINPEQINPLQELLREGAHRMLATPIEAEIEAFIAQHQGIKAAIVRNGYLPTRSIQTGLGDIDVKVPKVRDRSGSGINLTVVWCSLTRSVLKILTMAYLSRPKDIYKQYRLQKTKLFHQPGNYLKTGVRSIS